MIGLHALALVMALNADVTPSNIHSTICVRGWSASLRPQVRYTQALKRAQLPMGAKPWDFEEDHIIPICLGGHPTDPQNLRPQPWAQARAKDREEARLCKAVCADRMGLREAQNRMARWPN